MSGRARIGAAPQRARLPDGRRWHFHHGPIDLILEAFGDARDCARAYDQAWARFETTLEELVSELPLLRAPVVPPSPHPLRRSGERESVNTRGLETATPSPPRGGEGGVRGTREVEETSCPLRGTVARRMWHACRPFAGKFITPMAAVAGAVADEVLAAMTASRDLAKAYVNDGGDIALHLAPGECFHTGIVGDIAKPKLCASAAIAARDPIRGVATSGWRGRSFSLGIADAVTVLAATAAAADAAATMIANEVDIDHPAVRRAPARELDPDSDLGDHRVTVAVGELDRASVEQALARGHAAALGYCREGLIAGAYLTLCGCERTTAERRARRAERRDIEFRSAQP